MTAYTIGGCWSKVVLPTSYRATIIRGGVAVLTVGNGTDYPWNIMPTGLGTVTRQELIPVPGGGAIPSQADVDEVGEIGMEVHVRGVNPLHAEQLADALNGAWGARPDLEGFDTLALEMVSGMRFYSGRPLGPQVILDPIARFRSGVGRLTFVVAEPGYVKGGVGALVPTPHTVLLTLGATGGGWGEPWGEPWGEGASGGGSDTTIAQAGNFPSKWVAVFTALTPLENPTLRLGGQLFTIAGIIPAGSQLIVDTRTGLITLDGSPRSWAGFDAVWFDVPPTPAVSALAFRATSGTGTVSFTYYDTSH